MNGLSLFFSKTHFRAYFFLFFICYRPLISSSNLPYPSTTTLNKRWL